jgi:hypothetical protein
VTKKYGQQFSCPVVVVVVVVQPIIGLWQLSQFFIPIRSRTDDK